MKERGCRNIARLYGGVIGGMTLGVRLGILISGLVDYQNGSAGGFWVTLAVVTFGCGFLAGKLVSKARRKVLVLVTTLPIFGYALMGLGTWIAIGDEPIPSISSDYQRFSVGWASYYTDASIEAGFYGDVYSSDELGYSCFGLPLSKHMRFGLIITKYIPPVPFRTH